jgi:hypothetical protein
MNVHLPFSFKEHSALHKNQNLTVDDTDNADYTDQKGEICFFVQSNSIQRHDNQMSKRDNDWAGETYGNSLGQIHDQGAGSDPAGK